MSLDVSIDYCNRSTPKKRLFFRFGYHPFLIRMVGFYWCRHSSFYWSPITKIYVDFIEIWEQAYDDICACYFKWSNVMFYSSELLCTNEVCWTTEILSLLILRSLLFYEKLKCKLLSVLKRLCCIAIQEPAELRTDRQSILFVQ